MVVNAMPKTSYDTTPEVFNEAMDHVARSLQQCLRQGFVDPSTNERYRIAIIAIKGDAPYLTKTGNFYRSYNTFAKRGQERGPPKGVCPYCLAGTRNFPAEDLVGCNPCWLTTIGVKLPWLRTPSFIRHLPHDRGNPVSMYKSDIWHVVHLGFGRSWIASVIQTLLPFLPQPNLDEKWAYVSDSYLTWCRANKKQTHISKITPYLMSYGDSSGAMGNWHKGALTCNFFQWLVDFLGKVPGDPDGLLVQCRQATYRMNSMWSMLYRAGAFLDANEGAFVAQQGLEFLRVYVMCGGGEGSTAREVLRHKSVEKCVMVDIDGDVVDFCKAHLPANSEAFADPRLDLIIDDCKEFYEMCKTKLNPDGILVTQASGAGVKMYKAVLSPVLNTLKQVFPAARAYKEAVYSFADEWGFVIGHSDPSTASVTPEEIDRRIAERISSSLSFLDGESYTGIFCLSKQMRLDLAAEKRILSKDNPAVFLKHMEGVSQYTKELVEQGLGCDRIHGPQARLQVSGTLRDSSCDEVVEFKRDMLLAQRQQEMLEKQEADRAAYFQQMRDKQSKMLAAYEAGVGNELEKKMREDEERAKRYQAIAEEKEMPRQNRGGC
eukprot:s459_g26.t1